MDTGVLEVILSLVWAALSLVLSQGIAVIKSSQQQEVQVQNWGEVWRKSFVSHLCIGG